MIIKTNKEYKRALQRAEDLIDIDPEVGTDNANELDLLSSLINKYEDEQFEHGLCFSTESNRI